MLEYNQFDTDVEATTVMKVNIIGAGIAGLSAGCYGSWAPGSVNHIAPLFAYLYL